MALTREQMEEVLKNGGTVLIGNKHVTSLANLPSKDVMAKTSEEKEAAAEDLKAQMADMQRRLNALQGESGGKSDDKSEGDQLIASGDAARNREAQVKALTRKNLDDLGKIVKDMREEGYVIEFADDAKKEVIIDAIVDAKKGE